MNTHIKVLLAGGGTAGHVNPLLSLAHRLRQAGAQVEVLGTESGLETTLVPRAGLTLHTIEKVPAPRRVDWQAMTFPLRLAQTVNATAAIIAQVQPDVVVGFGGYVSAPAYLAAKRAGVDFIIHEQNARPGWANRLGARWAALVTYTFADTRLRARTGATCRVGLPLRAEVGQLAAADRDQRRERREAALARFGLDPSRPVTLVTGGSLGSLRINRSVAEAVEQIAPLTQVLHLAGSAAAARGDLVRQAVADAGVEQQWRVEDYALDMDEYFAAADLVIGRAGAGTVAELMALGLPALYVPLPIGNGEQRLNATEHVDAGGAVLIEDAQFTASRLVATMKELFEGGRGESSSSRLHSMRLATEQLARFDAAERLAELTFKVANHLSLEEDCR